MAHEFYRQLGLPDVARAQGTDSGRAGLGAEGDAGGECPAPPSLWPSRIGGFVLGSGATFVGLVLLSIVFDDEIRAAYVEGDRWQKQSAAIDAERRRLGLDTY